MNILFLTSATEGVAGYWRSFYIAKYLTGLGHRVIMVCQNDGHSLRVTEKVIDDVKIYLLPSFHVFGRNPLKNIAAFFMQIGVNCILARESSFDIIQVFDAPFPQNSIPAVLWKYRRRFRKPILFVDWDDWWGRGGVLDLELTGIFRIAIPFLTFLEEKIPLIADAVTVTNETLRKRAINVGVKPQNLFVLPNGTNIVPTESFNIYDARLRLGLPPDAVIYYYHSRKINLDPKVTIKVPRIRKNIILLAHKIVVASFPNAFLFLLGDGSKAMKAYAKSIGCDKNILRMDFLPEKLYYLYLSAADFFLLVTEDNAFTNAAIPQRLMDYMAVGRPVITTELPEIRKLLGESGLFIKNQDENELAEKMVDAIRNPFLMKAKGDAAREKIKNQLSWKNVALQLEKSYYTFLSLDKDKHI